MTEHIAFALITKPTSEMDGPSQPLDRLMPLADVLNATSLRRSSLYDLVRDGLFPEPVKISRRRVAWRTSDVVRWIASQTYSRDARQKGGAQ